jgi:YhcH/YjgK/YiaL family protein
VIVDTLDHRHVYGALGPDLAPALEFLVGPDLPALACGRHALDGDRLYVVVSEYLTKPREEGRWEAHRHYVDVHAVLAGTEVVGYAPPGALQLVSEEPDRDLVWLAGRGDLITLRPGHFLVVWPGEAHMPGLALDAPATVKKVVVKVAVPPRA